MKEQDAQRMLGQTRGEGTRNGKGGLHWGRWLTAGCLLAGGAWGALAGSFAAWQALVLFVLAVVFGVHTLASSHLRTHRSDTPLQDDQYQALASSLDRAKGLLNQGHAGSALKVLETFVAKDRRGIHTASPEFYEILRACQQSLGQDTRNADSQIEELHLDWVTALKKGQQLLKAGKATESIVYFERSLQANPGEYGTASGEEAARRGIQSAEALINRQRESDLEVRGGT